MNKTFFSKIPVRNLAVTALFAAAATVLMYLEFSLPFVPGFLKFDFSDFPALIVSFALSPWYGALVCLLKNLLHLVVSNSMFVGELANFVLGVLFVVPAGLIYHRNKTKKNAVTGALLGTAVMGAGSFPMNYFLIYPIYAVAFGGMDKIVGAYTALLPSVTELWQALVVVNVPFTLAKGLIATVITLLIYKKLSPVIKGERR